jgi:hypothetical protein
MSGSLICSIKSLKMNNKNVKQALFGGTNGRRRAKERVKGR